MYVCMYHISVPPEHFRYTWVIYKDFLRVRVLTIDDDNPPPSISTSILSKIPVTKLRYIARESGLKGWSELRKVSLVKFLKKHSFAIMDFLHEQTFPDTLSAWVKLFSTSGFAEHYTEVIMSTLTRMKYFKPNCHWLDNLCIVSNAEELIQFIIEDRNDNSVEYICDSDTDHDLEIDDETDSDLEDEFYDFIENVYNESDSESDY